MRFNEKIGHPWVISSFSFMPITRPCEFVRDVHVRLPIQEAWISSSAPCWSKDQPA